MRRLLRGCATVLAVLVLVVVSGYVVHGLSGLGEVRAAKRQAVADIEQGLGGADRLVSRHEVRVRRELGLGEPAYRWHELSCSLSTRDAGWMVQSYTQVCEVRAVELHPLDSAGTRCEDVLLSPTLGAEIGAHARVVRGPSAALSDSRPWEHQCPSNVARPDRVGETRQISGDRPGSLSGSPGWLAVTASASVGETDLGCSPWGVLFCSAPVDEPVLPRS